MREILLPNDVLWAVPFAGGTPRRPALVAAATGSPVADRSAGSLAVFNDYGALWPTQQEACPRGRRCLVFRVTDGGAWTGPKDIVRSVPLDGPYFADATLTMAVGYGRIAGAWTERRPEASGLPEARLAYLCTGVIQHNTGCQRHERHLFDAPGSPNASLGAPNLVTGRAFNASVTGRNIRRVRISLLPPRCRPRSTGDQCFALRQSRADRQERYPVHRALQPPTGGLVLLDHLGLAKPVVRGRRVSLPAPGTRDLQRRPAGDPPAQPVGLPAAALTSA